MRSLGKFLWQLVLGDDFVIATFTTITAVPPTQEDAVVSVGRTPLRVRNITQESTRFAFILRYITSLYLC